MLKKPTLTLFAFHLRNELAQSNKPDTDADFIWEWCENLSQELSIKELEGFKNKLKKYKGRIGLPPTQDYPDSDYLELLEEQILIPFSIPNSQHKIKGAIYPLQIHDAYALNVSLNYQSETANVADLGILNPKGFLLPHNIKKTLKNNFLR